MDLDFTLENKLCELQQLQSRLEHLQTEWNICRKTISHINLILEELFSNIVMHGDQSSARQVHFSLKKHTGQLHITVTDDGPKFDLTCSKTPDTTLSLEKRKCGGLGILLVQKFCDSCSYTRKDGKNILSLIKNLPEECSEPLAPAKK